MFVQAWFRKGPQHRHNWKQTTSTFSGALLKQGLWVQLWSHLSCDGWDESGCKLTGNEGLYKRTRRIYKSPDNPCTGQLSLQGTESTEWIWTWNALQKPMLFFWSINISVLWLLNICPLCPPARSPNPSQKTDSKKGRKGQERTILFEPCSQFPGDFCLPLTFLALQLADEMDTLFYTGKKLAPFSPSPHLLQTWADSKCNSQLQTPSRASPSWGMSDSSLQSTAPSQSTALQTKPETFPTHSMWYEGNIAQTFY